MKHLLTVISFFLLAVGVNAQEDQVKPPQIGIRIPLGDELDLMGTTVRFDKVLEDSRCPTNVDCVWAGQAIVQLTVSREQGDFEVKEITFKANTGALKETLLIAGDEGYKIYALALKPYPEKPGEPLDYAVVVVGINDQ
jgi:hypothetical protein